MGHVLPEDGGRRTAAASFATSAPRTLAEQLDDRGGGDDARAARPRSAGAARPQSAGAAGGGGRAAYQAMLARDAGRGAGAAQFHSKPLVPMD